MNLDKLIVALDSGHGGHDPGAAGRFNPEKHYNLLVTEEVRLLLLMEGAWPTTLRWSRELNGIDNKQYLTLRERSRQINRFRTVKGREVDLVLCIHHNSASNRRANGLEVWHFTGSVRGEALGRGVLAGMEAAMPLRSRGLKHTRRFSMLKHPKPPSIITEGAFVSNAGDEKWLLENYKVEAAGIVAGLKLVEW